MLGEIIKKLRKNKGITQEELGKIIGVTTSMVGMYETNARKPSYEVLSNIAEYFNVSTDYLLGKVPFKNEDEALTSISIASVKYIMNNRNEFEPYFADGSMDYYYELFYESNKILYNYINRLITMYENKDPKLTNIEYFELANILFKDIKYNKKTYDGLIYLTDFYDGTGVVKLDLNTIPRFTKQSINFEQSLLYKIMGSKESDYTTYTSLLNTISNNEAEGMTSNTRGYDTQTIIAAHIPEGVELTEEEQQELNNYIQFLLSKRKK